MKFLKIFALMMLMLFVAQGRTFAAMPEISAGEMYFDVFKGCYVLKGNVHVAADNHGFKAVITADEALVNVVKQKCWADGHVKLKQDNITFSCDRAYLQWQTKTAEVTGSVKFANKKSVTINSDTAVFNWRDKKPIRTSSLRTACKLTAKNISTCAITSWKKKFLRWTKLLTFPKLSFPILRRSDSL